MSDASIAAVRFRRTPSGREVVLEPGHVIGRSAFAALQLNEPGVSEAHALVSLRGSQLKLLALRGRFMLDGEVAADVVLRPGQSIVLARDVVLEVVEVRLPESVLGVVGEGVPRQVLPSVAAVMPTPPLIRPGFHAGHLALIWTDGDRFLMRRPGAPDVPLDAGSSHTLGGRQLTFVAVPLAAGGVLRTERRAAWDAPLALWLRYDSVHIERGRETVVISGLPARLLSELALMGVPADWEVIARELWDDEDDSVLLRQRWDRTLARLRRSLKGGGLPSSLLRSDGRGRIELVLGHDAVIHDQT